MRSDIVPGAAFPDYELPDLTGILRRLSEPKGDEPLILTLALWTSTPSIESPNRSAHAAPCWRVSSS